MATMRRILGRSTDALRHAIHKMFFCQLLHTPADDLFQFYNLDKDSVAKLLVQDKYDVPLEDADADAEGWPGNRMSQLLCMATSAVLMASGIALCVGAALDFTTL